MAPSGGSISPSHPAAEMLKLVLGTIIVIIAIWAGAPGWFPFFISAKITYDWLLGSLVESGSWQSKRELGSCKTGIHILDLYRVYELSNGQP